MYGYANSYKSSRVPQVLEWLHLETQCAISALNRSLCINQSALRCPLGWRSSPSVPQLADSMGGVERRQLLLERAKTSLCCSISSVEPSWNLASFVLLHELRDLVGISTRLELEHPSLHNLATRDHDAKAHRTALRAFGSVVHV